MSEMRIPEWLRPTLERVVKADASMGATAVEICEGWKAMDELRALLRATAAPTVKAEQVQCEECGGNGAGGDHEDDCSQAPSLPAAGSADLPPPDFTLDCGSQPCYYAETVRRIVAALSAQQSAHVSVPRELLERICWSVISSSDLHTHNEAVRELRALLNGGEA